MTDNDLLQRDAGVALPPSLQLERHGAVAVLRLTRAAKRNALERRHRAGHGGVLRRAAGGGRPRWCWTPTVIISPPVWICPS